MRKDLLADPTYGRRMQKAAGIKPRTGGVTPPTPKISQVKTGGVLRPSVKPAVKTGGPAKKRLVTGFNPKKLR
jgi:hypothetical protein